MGLAELVERVTATGEIPTAAELDPYLLGATPSLFGESGRSGTEDQYVARTHHDVDIRLAAALAGDRLVLVSGPSKAGKTRTLFEAVRAELPNARVVVPTPQTLALLPDCVEFTEGGDPLVVWLEDLHRFLTGEALTPALLARLTARRARTLVAATLRDEARDRLRASTAELTHETRVLLQEAIEIALAPTSESPSEQAAAGAAYPSLNLARYGLAEALAGAPELLRRYDDARFSNPVVYAVTQVAVDWTRIGRDDPIPEPTLAALALATVEELRPDLDITTADVETAIRTARTPPAGAGRVAALLTTRLPDRSRSYRAFDYLVAADDGQQHRTPRPIPSDIWRTATEGAETSILVNVGNTAFIRHQVHEAETLYRRVGTGNIFAMHFLGFLLQQRGEIAEAETWYRKAVDAGNFNAIYFLGRLLEERGEIAEAETWYRRGIDAGESNAMYSLGRLLQQRGEIAEAETWYRRGIDAGESNAMYSLGRLLQQRGEIAEAET
ncbi:tetratricopeptide repeat protein, partial [Nocardia sp. NPDC050408]|uniref:tetratricopeptide repeat protein n=1 Tax=Nocardia sp. NPDC050408 TaxID=3364319 RepID=UPI0037B9826A